MKVAIIEYNAGNVQSVLFALERLGIQAVLTQDHEQICSASHVLFPGVGQAGSAMQFLRAARLDELIKSLTMPVLGICLGLQLMCRHSQESDTDGINIFDTDVLHFDQLCKNSRLAKDHSLKIPHIGWNTIDGQTSISNPGIHPLLHGLPNHPHLYYVHSYAAPISDYTIAQTNYIVPFSGILAHKNFYAIQAHPEKSGTVGQRILENFLKL